MLISWLPAALLACAIPAAALSPAAEQALRQAAPGGERAAETSAASLAAAGRLASAGMAERDAVKLVIRGLQVGRGPKELEALAGAVASAVGAGLKPAVAAAVAGDALGHGVAAAPLEKLLSVSREAIEAGATARETRYVADSALRRGGMEGAAGALESFKTLVGEGVDERDARRAVLKIVAQKADAGALRRQARADLARSLEEKRLERERAREEERRQRDEEKRDERRAAADGGTTAGDPGGTGSGNSGSNNGPGGGDCPGGDDDPSDPDCD